MATLTLANPSEVPMPSETYSPIDGAPPAPSQVRAAFQSLIAALRAAALDGDFERHAAYLRNVERMQQRYAAGQPLNERARKEG